MGIKVVNISKSFGYIQVVNNIKLDIPTGKLTALLGPSGSGKTTLLRLIAGLEIPDEGQIFFHDQDITHLNAADRRVGFVFQHYALFKHMTIFDNIAFGLKVRPRKLRPSKNEIRQTVTELLQLIKLEEFANRYPSQLSGGQRQRVALARALAIEPQFLLLDEPFAALDTKVRQELRRWLRELHETLQITSVIVTHDQEEALEVADRIVVMNEGEIEQVGSSEEIYYKPKSPFVCSFIGRTNSFLNNAQHQDALAFIRPHEVEIKKLRTDHTDLEATVKHIFFVGPLVRIVLQRRDTLEMVEAEMAKERFDQFPLKVDEYVYINLQQAKIFIQDKVI